MPVEPGEHEDPGEPRHDERQRGWRGRSPTVGQSPGPAVDGALDDAGEVESDEQEDGVLEQELDRLPVEPLGDARLGRLDGRASGSRAGCRRRRPRARRSRPIACAMMNARYGVMSDRLVSSTGARRRFRTSESTQPMPRPTPTPPTTASAKLPAMAHGFEHGDAHDRHDRGVERDEGRGVVQQALALEDRHQAAGKLQASGDGRHGHGIRRRDDRAEGERRGERDRRNQHPGGEADHDDGEGHQARRRARRMLSSRARMSMNDVRIAAAKSSGGMTA